jgi:5-hydroxyisourate hydrolase-like protein (transthyretin family)
MSWETTKRSHAAALLLTAVALAGCGPGLSVPSTAPVTGVVTYKGKPLQGIRVTLHSQDGSDKGTFLPTGETGPDGKFFLSTGAPRNGAPPGTYVVTFEKPEIGSSAATASIETEIDAFAGKYSDPAQSKWTVTIEDGENALPPFALE